MPRLHLTDKAIQGLRTAKVQEDFYDTLLPGFGVRVGKGGGRSFFVRYRGSGKNRRVVLGSYPAVTLSAARDKARALMGEVARDLDPARKLEEDRGEITFGELAATYLDRHARAKKRTWKEDERILERELLPAWRGIKADSIRKAELLAALEQIVDRGAPIMANRTLAVVRKIYNWGLSRDLVETSPCLGVARPADETTRDRVLSGAEIKALWAAWDQENRAIGAALMILLLTAQRLGEVTGMRWSQLEGDLWTLAADSTKAKRVHVVPLSRQARALMESLPREPGSDWVICSPRKADSGLFPASLGHAARRMQEKLGFDWRVHDLRRTAATHMARLGADRLVVSRILNHADPSVTGVYDRYSYVEEKRRALQAWADELDRIRGAER